MSILKMYLALVSLCVTGFSCAHNGELLDTIVESRVSELGITEMIVTYHTGDTSYVHEIKRYNNKGQVIEKRTPSYDGYSIHRTSYDSLGRTTRFTIYSEIDTALIESERIWTYTDSMHYTVERFGDNHQLYETTAYEIVETDSAVWIYETEKYHPSNRLTKSISKYTVLSDSLRITEFVRFDREGKMDEITSYYELLSTDSTLQQRTKTEGSCGIISDELEELSKKSGGLREYYENKEKYLQNQLDGNYSYELSYSPHTFKIYNFDGQLIQDGYGIFDKKTFIYNDKSQFVKIIGWGSMREDHGIVETSETTIEYHENGLPISMSSLNFKNQRTESYTFEYN